MTEPDLEMIQHRCVITCGHPTVFFLCFCHDDDCWFELLECFCQPPSTKSFGGSSKSISKPLPQQNLCTFSWPFVLCFTTFRQETDKFRIYVLAIPHGASLVSSFSMKLHKQVVIASKRSLVALSQSLKAMPSDDLWEPSQITGTKSSNKWIPYETMNVYWVTVDGRYPAPVDG